MVIKEEFGITSTQTEANLDGEGKLKLKGKIHCFIVKILFINYM